MAVINIEISELDGVRIYGTLDTGEQVQVENVDEVKSHVDALHEAVEALGGQALKESKQRVEEAEKKATEAKNEALEAKQKAEEAKAEALQAKAEAEKWKERYNNFASQYREWKEIPEGTRLEAKTYIVHKFIVYEVVQPHDKNANWEPGTEGLGALYTIANKTSESGDVVLSDWKQPTGEHDAYKTGDKVIYKDGLVYISKVDWNTAEPTKDEPYNRYWQRVE